MLVTTDKRGEGLDTCCADNVIVVRTSLFEGKSNGLSATREARPIYAM